MICLASSPLQKYKFEDYAQSFTIKFKGCVTKFYLKKIFSFIHNHVNWSPIQYDLEQCATHFTSCHFLNHEKSIPLKLILVDNWTGLKRKHSNLSCKNITIFVIIWYYHEIKMFIWIWKFHWKKLQLALPQVTFLCGMYVMILTTIFCNLAISNQKTATSD